MRTLAAALKRILTLEFREKIIFICLIIANWHDVFCRIYSNSKRSPGGRGRQGRGIQRTLKKLEPPPLDPFMGVRGYYGSRRRERSRCLNLKLNLKNRCNAKL